MIRYVIETSSPERLTATNKSDQDPRWVKLMDQLSCQRTINNSDSMHIRDEIRRENLQRLSRNSAAGTRQDGDDMVRMGTAAKRLQTQEQGARILKNHYTTSYRKLSYQTPGKAGGFTTMLHNRNFMD